VAEERCGDGAEEVRTVTLCHPAARWWQRKVELAFGVWEGGIHSRWLRGDWGVDDGARWRWRRLGCGRRAGPELVGVKEDEEEQRGCTRRSGRAARGRRPTRGSSWSQGGRRLRGLRTDPITRRVAR
jgi:hypothetical protein